MTHKTDMANNGANGTRNGLAVLSTALAGRPESENPYEVMSEDAAPGGSPYFHALRRRWVVATLVGLLCAAGMGGAAWFTGHGRYTATALLRVASKEQQLVFRTMDQDVVSDFDTYRTTQQQLVKSRFVLTAAVRNPAIANLPLLRQSRDPIAWLEQNLTIVVSGRSELMPVQLSGDDPGQIVAIVNAVIQAYLNEVVDVERNQRRQRLNELDRVYTDTETAIRRKRSELKQLAEQLGTGDTAALNLKQQITLQQFADLQNESTRMQFERMRAEVELHAKRQILGNPDAVSVSPLELDSYARTDPVVAQLLVESGIQEYRAAYDESAAVQKGSEARRQDQRRDLETIQQRIQARKDELVKELRTTKHAGAEADVKRLEANIEMLKAQEKRLAEAIIEAKTQATAVGESSVDMELMRAELKQSEAVLNGIAEERERLGVELRTEPRITLLQKAELPDSPDRTFLALLTVGAALLGLAAPVFAIAWWDVRAQHVNTSAQISRDLGLAVVGSLPAVPVKAIHESHSLSRRQRYWRERLTEAVDGIVAALLRRKDTGQNRVILVSSAANGEGKTTLATQLALSLARTGHRTALLDFDLRRPALNTLFQTALTPGISEILRHEKSLEETGRPVADSLVLFTAGDWSQRGISLLAHEAPANLFESLRKQYEFVIVDGSPVLPVADVRFVCQHVDAVLLCVLRDISRNPQVLAAWEVFRQLGVENLGAVVIGVSGEGHYPKYFEEVEVPGLQ